MNGSTTVAVPQAGRGTAAVLSLAALAGLTFIGAAALPYFLRIDEAQFRQYWPMRGWLLLHVSAGMVALLAGPVQIWLGLRDAYPRVHKNLGFVYMAAITLGAASAYYLSFNTSGGWVFGAGLAGLATAWLVTTGLAFLAIKRHLLEQHKEWMIRSYVVTFGFVSFRVLFSALEGAGVGTLQEQLGASAWFCWSVPLLLNEAVLQGRKILRVRTD
jgi:uncharacterized membrane protein